MELNNENKFGHVNSSVTDFNHGISENSKCVYPAKGSHRKGKWSPQEDEMLIKFVEEYGTEKENGNVEVKWVVIAHQLNRSYKSCRLRWCNQLAPGISFERFSPEEDDLIIRMVGEIGPKWSKIAEMLKCRTDNQVKNRWNSSLINVQGQKLPEKVSSRRVAQTSKQGEKSTHKNKNVSHSRPSSSSNSTLQLISNSTFAGPMAEVPSLEFNDFLRPYLPDGSLYCHHSPAFDTPNPSATYASPDPASTFEWLYSPSLHPPGCEIPDVMYPYVNPEPSTSNLTQETQCASVGGITEPMETEPQKPACNLPGFDWLNME